MNVEQAAHGTRTLLESRFRPGHQIEPKRSQFASRPPHAMWMLDEIIKGEMKNDRANRWLGYAQAIFIVFQLLTLEDVKQINKAA